MSSLRIVYINQNRLKEIPVSLGKCKCIKELRLGQNSIRLIPEDFARGGIGESLETIWLYANAILDLPRSFNRLQSLKDIRLDGNPIRSPPSQVLRLGVKAILRYCAIREARVQGKFFIFNI